MYCCILFSSFNNHPGAGVYATKSKNGSRPIVNNGLIVSASNGLQLNCISNSSQSGVVMITGLDGNTLPTGNGDVWRLTYPFSRPGYLCLQNISTSLITAADQGIYTCTIPDSNNKDIIIKVGLYPSGFMGEFTCASQ